MQIAVIFLAVAGYIYVLYSIPRLRISGGIFAAVIVLGLGVYMATTEPEPVLEVDRISVDEVSLSDMEFDLGVRTSSLSGRVVNNSTDYVLTVMTLVVKLYDCDAADTPLADCFIIGEDDGLARVSVPPGQLRDFKATLLFNGLPEIEGVLRWDFHITGTRAIIYQPS